MEWISVNDRLPPFTSSFKRGFEHFESRTSDLIVVLTTKGVTLTVYEEFYYKTLEEMKVRFRNFSYPDEPKVLFWCELPKIPKEIKDL